MNWHIFFNNENNVNDVSLIMNRHEQLTKYKINHKKYEKFNFVFKWIFGQFSSKRHFLSLFNFQSFFFQILRFGKLSFQKRIFHINFLWDFISKICLLQRPLTQFLRLKQTSQFHLQNFFLPNSWETNKISEFNMRITTFKMNNFR